MSSRRVIVALLLANLLAGCPGALNQEDFDCITVTNTVLEARCATSGCHDTESFQVNDSDLDLSNDALPASVLRESTRCGGIIADPTDATNSLLYIKLTEQNFCNARMPLAGSPLSDFEIDCFRQWIETLEPPPAP